jgi:hypothetical protein
MRENVPDFVFPELNLTVALLAAEGMGFPKTPLAVVLHKRAANILRS